MPLFETFFKDATGSVPYDYQRRLACGEPGRTAGGDAGRPCESQLISIPTGLGKTAAVVLAWLWNRVVHGNESWPRRLVYCLPMRTLVEQTRDEIIRWIENLEQHADAIGLDPTARGQLTWLKTYSPIILMGGEELDEARREWDIHPERPAILIGTQDMLLSRALNRGYGMARARWPMHFGLLNNDALWVMDEIQLMDVGLATSAQLQSYRSADQQAGTTLRPCTTWWMSATLQPVWLESVDTRAMVESLRQSILGIPASQREGGIWEISKPCDLVALNDEKAWAKRVWVEHAKSVAGAHGRITLVIANTVRTACSLHTAIAAELKKAKAGSVELRLVHSRFRPSEREKWRDAFLNREACGPDADRIIVATQIVEAGVDISANTLFTELAPWPSLVQRFGRAARYGGTARVFVVDRDPTEATALPYKLEDLSSARKALTLLADASLAGLAAFESNHPDTFASLFPYEPLHLLLRRELEELFDTTPDLSGADLDISRFIRSGAERDVLVFWRDLPAKIWPDPTISATRDELCPVPVGAARTWITEGSAKGKAWVWDYLDDRWRKCAKDDIYPGQTILVAHSAGGYAPDRGWTGESGDRNFAIEAPSIQPLSADASAASDRASEADWQTIAMHSAEVARTAAAISTTLHLADPLARLLELGARWHDIGKTHLAFQSSIKSDATGHPGTHDLAKAPRAAWRGKSHLYTLPDGERRSGFRHELASTLALFSVLARHQPLHPALLGAHQALLKILAHPVPAATAASPATPLEQQILTLDQPAFDLLAYVICAHHGKVRTAWHTAPADQDYRDHDGRGLPIHGVREGDLLPAVSLTMAEGQPCVIPEQPLSLEPARLGLSPHTGASWSERVAGLLHAHGPLTLAYLEAIFRAADARASRPPTADSLPVANAAGRSSS